MLGESTKIEMEALATDIVKFAKINLGDKNRRRRYPSGRTVRGAINASGDLSDSLKSDVKVFDNSVSMEIEMLEYGEAVNDGRKAAYIPIAPLVKWIKEKRIRLRDDSGKFVGKMTDEKAMSLAIAISKSAKKHKRKPTNFLNEAVEDAVIKHEDTLTEALFTDIEQAVSFILNNVNNK